MACVMGHNCYVMVYLRICWMWKSQHEAMPEKEHSCLELNLKQM